MDKLRTFHSTLVKSCTKFEYYKDVVKTPFSFSLKYLALLVFVTTAIQIISISANSALLLPQLPSLVSNLNTKLDSAFEKDLVITLKKGVVSINKPTPYIMDFPEFTSALGLDHAVTFDPDAQINDFISLNTFVLVTDTEIAYREYSSSTASRYTVLPISPEDGDGVLDRAEYDLFLLRMNQVFEQIMRFAPVILVIFTIVMPFILTAIFLAWLMVQLIILTAIVFLVMKSFKQSIPFWKLYQMGMHGLSIPILVTFSMTMLGFMIPLVFTSIFLLWMVIVLSKMEEKVGN